MSEWMRLCGLEKRMGKETKMQQSWIPEQFASLGKFLKLKEEAGWEDGWQVTFVGPRKESGEVNKRSRDYKRQREASDI